MELLFALIGYVIACVLGFYFLPVSTREILPLVGLFGAALLGFGGSWLLYKLGF